MVQQYFVGAIRNFINIWIWGNSILQKKVEKDLHCYNLY